MGMLGDTTLGSLPNRFDKSYLQPGFAGQSWVSWILLFFLFVTVTALAASLDAMILGRTVRARA